jgi:hypothetical protein
MKLAALVVLFAATLCAQLAPPNAAGVSAGHHIFIVKDVEVANKFWNALGAGTGELGPLKMVKFPGVLFLVRAGNSLGGSEGSSVDFIGFKVRDLKAAVAALDAIGYKPLNPKLNDAQKDEAFFLGPDGVKVKLHEDKKLATAVAADEVRIAAPKEAAAWYAKYLGGPDIPGARLTFTETSVARAGTQGRALDRLGFEVADLAATVEKLKASGAKMNGAIANAKGFPLSVSILTDPWGTYIELSQGLNAVK